MEAAMNSWTIRMAKAGILLAEAALCVFLFQRFVIAPHHCNTGISHLITLSAIAEKTGNEYERSVFARRNLHELFALREVCPTAMDLYMLIAQNQRAIGDSEGAIQTYRDAIAIEPRPEFYQEIGIVFMETRRFEEAVPNFVMMVRFNTTLYGMYSAADPLRQRVFDALPRVERDFLNARHVND
jgi:tetratricopeptide (TPR) repeat protein